MKTESNSTTSFDNEILDVKTQILHKEQEDRKKIVYFLAPIIAQGEVSNDDLPKIFSYIDECNLFPSMVTNQFDRIIKTFNYNSNSLCDLYDELCDVFYEYCESEKIDEDDVFKSLKNPI